MKERERVHAHSTHTGVGNISLEIAGCFSSRRAHKCGWLKGKIHFGQSEQGYENNTQGLFGYKKNWSCYSTVPNLPNLAKVLALLHAIVDLLLLLLVGLLLLLLLVGPLFKSGIACNAS
jgi:hypothetical protein